MDRIDRMILSALQENARISNIELAQEVGLSPSACLRRVSLLEKSDVIQGYHADLSLVKLGHSVLVLVHITLHGQSAEMMAEFEKAVQRVPQVLACFLVAGENDYLLRIAARSVDDFGRIHTEYLSALPHVLRMESNFVMRTVMNRGLNAEDI
ncbi:MAG: Lrp/AsnC family transcriptional regulator [Candidatus Puniceispirillaceae bacterium]